MRSSSEVLSRSPKIARRAGIAFSFIRIVYHAAGSRPLLRRTLLRLRRTHLLRERSCNRQFLRRVCAPTRKARHAGGRSGAELSVDGSYRAGRLSWPPCGETKPLAEAQCERRPGRGRYPREWRKEAMTLFISTGFSSIAMWPARRGVLSKAPRGVGA